jgi:hypothetical protein
MIININGESREMTDEEVARIEELITGDIPSRLDEIEAQVLYTALMTDSLLEEDV